MLKITKINESFSYCDGTKEELATAFNSLKIYDPSTKYDRLVQIGIRSPYKCFGSMQQGKLLIYNGHTHLVDSAYKQPTFKDDVIEFKNILKDMNLPFEPYDYQIRAVGYALLYKRALLKSCTSCLDPNTEIEVDIPGYTEQEIKEMLDE